MKRVVAVRHNRESFVRRSIIHFSDLPRAVEISDLKMINIPRVAAFISQYPRNGDICFVSVLIKDKMKICHPNFVSIRSKISRLIENFANKPGRSYYQD